MRLQCLLVTREHELLELFRPALEHSGMEVEVRAEAASATEICRRRHLDGFLVDCDDVPGGQELMGSIRGSSSNRMSTILAVVNGVTSINQALERGANFVLGKPVEMERFHSYLKVARVFMEREHRRYFRFSVNLPVRVYRDEEQHMEGSLLNLSEGGLALRLAAGRRVEGSVHVSFEVPSIDPYRIDAKGEVVWSDGAGLIGVRFLYMADRARRQLLSWLEQLHAQMELREGAEDTVRS